MDTQDRGDQVAQEGPDIIARKQWELTIAQFGAGNRWDRWIPGL